MAAVITHHCRACSYNTPVLFSASVFSQNHTCNHVSLAQHSLFSLLTKSRLPGCDSAESFPQDSALSQVLQQQRKQICSKTSSPRSSTRA